MIAACSLLLQMSAPDMFNMGTSGIVSFAGCYWRIKNDGLLIHKKILLKFVNLFMQSLTSNNIILAGHICAYRSSSYFFYKGHYFIILIGLTNIELHLCRLFSEFAWSCSHCLSSFLEEGFSVLHLAVISRQPQNSCNSSCM